MGDASRPRECPRPPNVNQANLDCTHDNQINHDILRQLSSIIVLSFDHRGLFLVNILGKRSDLPFLRKSVHKKEENRGFFYAWAECLQANTSRTLLDDFAHEQTIIWRQSFAGQVIGSRPIKRNKNSLRIIIDFHVGLNISLRIIAVLSNSLVLVAL